MSAKSLYLLRHRVGKAIDAAENVRQWAGYGNKQNVDVIVS